eukprot:GILI01004924.1.p1 GENE.GILI01004924.1~~GILI01004924.1.p1  ORF type:complete len:284 (+),score=76.50 GILI01004924.1:50-901(+)
MSRPEHLAPPEFFYNEDEAKKYAQSSRMIEIQSQMSARAIELLMLPQDSPCMILDIGCGSGISGGVLAEDGHYWVGLDISPSMLDVAVEREAEGDMLLNDMGQGFKFRPGSFDGAISISALQWLCNVDRKGHEPWKRLNVFFEALYNCLARGARAVFQFYPETADQVDLITRASMRCGFAGGLVVDFPNSTKAKKYFLVLYAGMASGGGPVELPKALGTEEGDVDEHVAYSAHRSREERRRGKRVSVKSREWIQNKKERQRRQGREVKPDSKYTGRKRKGHHF